MASLTLRCSRLAIATNTHTNSSWRLIHTLQRRQQLQQACGRVLAAAAAAHTTTFAAEPKPNANNSGKFKHYYANNASNCLLSMRYDLYMPISGLPSLRQRTTKRKHFEFEFELVCCHRVLIDANLTNLANCECRPRKIS